MMMMFSMTLGHIRQLQELRRCFQIHNLIEKLGTGDEKREYKELGTVVIAEHEGDDDTAKARKKGSQLMGQYQEDFVARHQERITEDLGVK